MIDNFVSNIDETIELTDKSLVFLFYKRTILLNKKTNHIPYYSELKLLELNCKNALNIGSYKTVNCFCISISEMIENEDVLHFANFFEISGLLETNYFKIVQYAYHINYWYLTNKYCGSCGQLTDYLKEEQAKICTCCNIHYHPSISPAIIVGIVKNKEILLASSTRFFNNMYSVLAGYVEPGETLEECVHREVYEEVGITIKNLKYFNSQPWGTSQSLMVGFIAEYKSGSIKVDGEEISDAQWFPFHNLPSIPSNKSISYSIIDYCIHS